MRQVINSAVLEIILSLPLTKQRIMEQYWETEDAEISVAVAFLEKHGV